ncbi:hypothetical protein ACA910_004902 [Epithemia clementina (nom. ined.)]
MPRWEDEHDSQYRRADARTMLKKVMEVVAEESARSLLFGNDDLNQAPQFDRSEIQTGRVVGRGTYGVIREIQSINLKIVRPTTAAEGAPPNNTINSNSNGTSNTIDMNSLSSSSKRSGNIGSLFRQSSSFNRTSIIKANENDLTTRELLARRVWSRRGNKYVLKEIEASLLQMDRVTFLKGMIDLALEAKFLAALNHPHVIKLQGLSCMDLSATATTTDAATAVKSMSYFIILEHLEETLPQKLNAWMHQKRSTRGITGLLTGARQVRSKNLLTERLLVAYDVADVLNYLHCRDIIYRDLKPDNIGFTKSSELKLFDFGLAKELLDRDRQDDGTYLLTGFTGAIRYMAPEVGLRQPYNLKADVYSWSMLMWCIMALEPPFAMYTGNMILDRVFSKQYRPAVKEKWPLDVCALMKDCWEVNMQHRPSFEDIMARLKKCVSELDPEVASFMRSPVVSRAPSSGS